MIWVIVMDKTLHIRGVHLVTFHKKQENQKSKTGGNILRIFILNFWKHYLSKTLVRYLLKNAYSLNITVDFFSGISYEEALIGSLWQNRCQFEYYGCNKLFYFRRCSGISA